MRRLRITLLLMLVLSTIVLVVPAGASARGCANANAHPSETSSRAAAKATVCLINRERARRRIGKLRMNSRLSRAARNHARDMVHRRYFSHSSASGASFLDRIRGAGYFRGASSWAAGENIAWGSGSRATPRAIVRSWMNSPGHKANILKRSFREVGAGLSQGSPRGGFSRSATFVHDFGRR